MGINYITLLGKDVKQVNNNATNNTAKAKGVLRQEFNFYANDEVLDQIFKDIADAGVTLIAFTITAMNRRNTNFVRMVVGPPNANSSYANRVARNALHSAGVQYHEKEVLQIIAAPSPGFGRSVFQTLYNLRLFATYSAANGFILNISNPETALKILKQNNIIN